MSALRPRISLSSAVCCLMAASSAFAATSPGFGEAWIVDTSVPSALQTLTVEIPSSHTALGNFEYELGFGTAEQATLGELFDSLTISLSRADGSQSANVATADIFGLTLAPVSSGSLLENVAVNVTQITSDTITLRQSPTMFAYSIGLGLPPELAGQNLRTTFSFFNNGDEVASVSYASVVPEPRSVALLFVGVVVLVSRILRRAPRA